MTGWKLERIPLTVLASGAEVALVLHELVPLGEASVMTKSDVVDGRERAASVEVRVGVELAEEAARDDVGEVLVNHPAGSPGKTRFRLSMSSGVLRVFAW